MLLVYLAEPYLLTIRSTSSFTNFLAKRTGCFTKERKKCKDISTFKNKENRLYKHGSGKALLSILMLGCQGRRQHCSEYRQPGY